MVLYFRPAGGKSMSILLPGLLRDFQSCAQFSSVLACCWPQTWPLLGFFVGQGLGVPCAGLKRMLFIFFNKFVYRNQRSSHSLYNLLSQKSQGKHFRCFYYPIAMKMEEVYIPTFCEINSQIASFAFAVPSLIAISTFLIVTV